MVKIFPGWETIGFTSRGVKQFLQEAASAISAVAC